MQYQTRHMVAKAPFRHGRDLAAGEKFQATPNDADYLQKMGLAEPTKSEVVAVVPEERKRGPGRPSNAELAARSAKPEPATHQAAAAPSGDMVMTITNEPALAAPKTDA